MIIELLADNVVGHLSATELQNALVRIDVSQYSLTMLHEQNCPAEQDLVCDQMAESYKVSSMNLVAKLVGFCVRSVWQNFPFVVGVIVWITSNLLSLR